MRSAHTMYDCNIEKYFVAKCYFGKAAAANAVGSVRSDVEMQIVAKKLAVQFSLSEHVEYAGDFILTCWYEIETPTEVGLPASMVVFTAEPYIEGAYRKYNNNNGWINESGLDMSNTAQAFRHFTWEATFGQLMVVSIQGVGCIFTDPQIHSVQGDIFGRGNLSKNGITAFFVTHECNAIYKTLGLRSPKGTSSEKKEDVASKSAADVPTDKREDKLMTCSCPLCGRLATVMHSKFIAEYRKNREVYCESCTRKVSVREPRLCNLCGSDFNISAYWYLMKGMDPPASCKTCKEIASIQRVINKTK